MTQEKEKTVRHPWRWLLIELLIIAIVIAVVIMVLQREKPEFLQVLREGDVEQVENYIRSEGDRGWYILVGLQILETISIVLPALPVYIAAGVLFGKLQGFIMCYLTNLVMNMFLYRVASRIQIPDSWLQKLEKRKFVARLLGKRDRPTLMIILLCFFPMLPGGVIPFVAMQQKVRFRDFIKGVAIGSFPAILFYVSSGDLILNARYREYLPVVVAVLLFAAAIWFAANPPKERQ